MHFDFEVSNVEQVIVTLMHKILIKKQSSKICVTDYYYEMLFNKTHFLDFNIVLNKKLFSPMFCTAGNMLCNLGSCPLVFNN